MNGIFLCIWQRFYRAVAPQPMNVLTFPGMESLGGSRASTEESPWDQHRVGTSVPSLNLPLPCCEAVGKSFFILPFPEKGWIPFSSHILVYMSIKVEQCYYIFKKALCVHWRTSLPLVSGTTCITEVKRTEKLSPVTSVDPDILCIHFQSSSKQHAGREKEQ